MKRGIVLVCISWSLAASILKYPHKPLEPIDDDLTPEFTQYIKYSQAKAAAQIIALQQENPVAFHELENLLAQRSPVDRVACNARFKLQLSLSDVHPQARAQVVRDMMQYISTRDRMQQVPRRLNSLYCR